MKGPWRAVRVAFGGWVYVGSDGRTMPSAMVEQILNLYWRETMPPIFETPLQRIERKLDRILGALKIITKDEKNMALDISDLQNAVAETKAGEESAIALVNGLAAKIDDLIAASGNTVDPATLADLASQLRTEAAALGAAVVAHPV